MPHRFALPYQEGRNLLLLAEVLDELDRRDLGADLLLRASEDQEIERLLTHGTDRGGFPVKVAWRDGAIAGRAILHEDVIYGTTAEEIRVGESDPDRSTSFKKLPGIERPLVIAYGRRALEKIADRQYLFRDPSSKLDALLAVCTVTKHPAIEGWFSEAAGLAYRNLVESVRGGTIVEVGCWKGLSTSYVARAAAARGTRMIGIDAWDGSSDSFDAAYRARLRAEDVPATFRANMRRLDLEVEVRQARSPDAARDFADAALDLVFLDASHDAAAVAADLAAWHPKLKPGGTLAGHDHSEKHPGVVRAVAAFAASIGQAPNLMPGGVWWLRR